MKKSFTLIELLVVIAIIGILAGMLLPALSKAREKARSIGCVNNLNNLGKGIRMYQDANDSLTPGIVGSSGNYGTAEFKGVGKFPGGTPFKGATVTWREAIAMHGPEVKTYVCGSASSNAYGSGDTELDGNGGLKMPTGTTAISSGNKYAKYGHYGMNGNAVGRADTNFVSAAACAMVMDVGEAAENSYIIKDAVAGNDATATDTILNYRHADMINVCYADGHTESVKFQNVAAQVKDVPSGTADDAASFWCPSGKK